MKSAMTALRESLVTEAESEKIQEKVLNNFYVDDSVAGMDALPDFLSRKVLRGEYQDVDVIIVDSLQGTGTSPTSTHPWKQLYQFCRWVKQHNISTLLIGHVTKSGAIAGPRSLEHNVDCVLYMRRAMKLRPLFMPKNRFGPARFQPFPLVMEKDGVLEKSPHMESQATFVYAVFPGTATRIGDLIDIQAMVKLPKFGEKAAVLAPYLPKQRIKQIISIVSSVKDVDISDLTFEINCYVPRVGQYSSLLDFPLAVALLSSYLREGLEPGTVLIGEVDLSKQVRPLDDSEIDRVSRILADTDKYVGTVYTAAASAEPLKQAITSLCGDDKEIRVKGVSSLEEFISMVWPHTFSTGSEQFL